MPLSKVRDRARKQKERAKSRLDRLLCPPSDSGGVQPNPTRQYDKELYKHGATPVNYAELDADGNQIPDY